VASPGLTYTGYLSSGIGNATSASANGEDVFKATTTSITTGSAYFSFMVNASPNMNTAGYGIHLSQAATVTNGAFFGRFWIQKDTNNNLAFGLTKANGTAQYTTFSYSTGVTYLIVIKYTFNPNAQDDAVAMWVNPTLGIGEPTPTISIASEATSDATAIAAVGIRQWNAGALARWDGIRVGTTWDDIAPAANTGSIDTYGTTSLTFSSPVGVTSASQTYDLEGVDTTTDITITAPAHWELYSAETGWGNPIVVTSTYKTISVRYTPTAAGTETGNITHVAGNADQVNIAVSGTGTTVASITATPNSLTYSVAAGSSAVQSYLLHGTNLTESIAVTAPTNYLVSTSASGPWTSTLSLASSYNANVYVQFTAPGYGAYDGTLTNVANGITTNVALYGTGTSQPTNIGIDTGITEAFSYIGTSATATLPTNWKADKNTTARLVGTYGAAVSATERQGGNSMSSTASNGIYNFGAGDAATATDRCVGFLSSSSATKSGNLYVKLTNTATSALTAVDLSYAVEKYRTGTNAAGYQVQLYYSLDDVTYTAAGSDFLNYWPADATTDGYASAPGDVQNVTSKRLAVTVPASGNLYLAWNYSVATGTTTSFAQAFGIDDITITGKQVLICATPTFSPLPGIYYPSQNVTLSCATAGAEIHYTLDGSTPNATYGLIYSTPISVTTTTTIKAVAVKTGYDISGLATGTYTIPIAVSNIAALRAETVGSTIYRLNGEAVLTLQSTVTASKNKYIQDATGAIQIYDPTPYKMTTAYNLGDGITGITGTLTLYAGMLEFIPVQDAGAATSSGHVVVPEVKTLAGLATTDQAKLVTINNILFNPATPTPFPTTPATNYTITDPSGTGVLRTAYLDLDYIGTAVPTTVKNITGVILQYTAGSPAVTTLQFIPRSLADFVDGVPAPINVIVTVDGDDIHLDWDAVSGATSYKIQVSDTPNGTFTDLTTSTTNSKVLAGDAGTYGYRFYKIIAVQ